MKITPYEFLEALELWKKQAENIIKNSELVEYNWEDILQDMEDFASENVIE